MQRFVVVVPTGAWTMHESSNRRGRPASHIALAEGGPTLCGRDCSGWMFQSGEHNHLAAPVKEIGTHGMCKICLRKWQALSGTGGGVT